MKTVKMKDLIIKNNIFLAPMAGVTDLPFRLLCKEKGAALVYTEMISAKGILYNNEKTNNLFTIAPEERPCVVQLFGSDPEILSEMAKKIEDIADIIDINMGCPAQKIIKNGEGSALMKEPERIGKIVYAVSQAITKPVTVKIRAGFNQNCINAVEIAKIAEESGAAAIAVHGRTREQFYSGTVDLSIIKAVKDSVSIPVIGSGDVVSALTAQHMFEETNCDAIMIGRGSYGNPWVFEEVTHFFETGEILSPPTKAEKIQMAVRHLDMAVACKGEAAVREMRKQLSWYIKGMDNCADVRVKINKTEEMNEMKELLYTLNK